MRARSAAALMEDCCTGSAAISTGSAHSAAVPQATTDHRRHAPLPGAFTGPRTSPLVSPDQRTSVRPGATQPVAVARYDKAMRTQIDIGVMSYAGLTDVRSQFFYEVDDDPASHEEHLRLAYDLGRAFLAAEPA